MSQQRSNERAGQFARVAPSDPKPHLEMRCRAIALCSSSRCRKAYLMLSSDCSQIWQSLLRIQGQLTWHFHFVFSDGCSYTPGRLRLQGYSAVFGPFLTKSPSSGLREARSDLGENRSRQVGVDAANKEHENRIPRHHCVRRRERVKRDLRICGKSLR